ncbi:MAG: ATP-binding cassette domain-containing protein [Bacteroidetes bacterium]|nr:ATP-binding cassette domain-containing protein [Bacteroidota bacterium]MCL2303326.1 ATP-binding cassette domain-containing protein [Lentimicrobiaceae bacterium]
MVRLSGITKKYPDGENSFNHVLRGVNMNVEKGDFIAIKGASGSGKTTLLLILGTLLQPDEGSYVLNNMQINTPGVDYSAIRNQKLGFVFQDHRLMPQLTALENILLPTLAFQNRTEDLQIDYAKQLMELTGITSVANQYPDTLSGGEASRTALCRALVMKPLLVLADEPTGQLDAENARNVALLLAKVNKELGTTIIMVTHSDETAAIAHRRLTLQNGGLS